MRRLTVSNSAFYKARVEAGQITFGQIVMRVTFALLHLYVQSMLEYPKKIDLDRYMGYLWPPRIIQPSEMLAEMTCPNEEAPFDRYGLITISNRVTNLRLGHSHHLVPRARGVLRA